MGPPRIEKAQAKQRKTRRILARLHEHLAMIRSPESYSAVVMLLVLVAGLIGASQSATTTRGNQAIPLGKRSSFVEKDFAPKLIHQPQSVHLSLHKPHTIECAVEARPEAEVKWFKDEQQLIVQPPHLEQSGNELMFFQINEHDFGQYYCQASNYLGAVTSEPFALTVQSSIHEPKIRFEPSVTEVAAERQAEFTCTIPMPRLNQLQQQQQPPSNEGDGTNERWPEVSWKRNGRPLQVRWLNNIAPPSSSSSSSSSSDLQVAKYLARQTKQSEFVLTLTRVQLRDDNATFTCLYRWPSSEADSAQDDEGLPRESSPVKLRVLESHTNQVKVDANLAPPIDNLADAKNPHELPAPDNDNTNTKLSDLSSSPGNGSGNIGGSSRVRNSLKQTLEDLYELAKPMLIIVGLLGFISSIVLVHLTLIRRRTRNQNRYMKHQYVGSGSSSNASSAIGGAPDCGDPVLSSLMARTLSAPSAVSLAGATKKYRSYRDHLRKVAAVQDMIVGGGGAEGDFVDGYFGPPAHLRGHHQISGSLSDQAPFFALPNLYNQSLAAREQARNLLQTNEHVRSLSNLSSQHLKQQQQQQQGNNTVRQQQLPMGPSGQLGSHLNLPLSFALANQNGRLDQQQQQQQQPQMGCQNNISSALWPSQMGQHARFNNQQNPNQQQNKHRLAGGDEQYQLVNCSSISPSSSNSGAVSSANSTGNDQLDDHLPINKQNIASDQSRLDSNSQNHYSTIENNDDEDRYEEVEQNHEQDHFRINRVSSFVKTDQQIHNNDGEKIFKNSTRSSILSNSSSSGCGDSTNTNTSSSLGGDIAVNRVGSKRTGRQQHSKLISQQDNKRAQHFQDQLSPYAVSSICNSIPPSHQPPPVPDSEAMQALYEQFDINQLMLLDESNSAQRSLPFDALPPPPPPPTDGFSSSQISRSQTRKKS